MVEQSAAEVKTKGPRTGIRKTFWVMTLIIILGIAAQVTLIGLALFYPKADTAEIHIGLGYMLGHFGPLLLIFGFFGRIGRTLTIVNAVNFVLLSAIPFLATVRMQHAILAGLHPLVAFTVFGLTLYTSFKMYNLIVAPANPATGPRLVPPPAQTLPRGRTLSNDR